MFPHRHRFNISSSLPIKKKAPPILNKLPLEASFFKRPNDIALERAE